MLGSKSASSWQKWQKKFKVPEKAAKTRRFCREGYFLTLCISNFRSTDAQDKCRGVPSLVPGACGTGVIWSSGFCLSICIGFFVTDSSIQYTQLSRKVTNLLLLNLPCSDLGSIFSSSDVSLPHGAILIFWMLSFVLLSFTSDTQIPLPFLLTLPIFLKSIIWTTSGTKPKSYKRSGTLLGAK